MLKVGKYLSFTILFGCLLLASCANPRIASNLDVIKHEWLERHQKIESGEATAVTPFSDRYLEAIDNLEAEGYFTFSVFEDLYFDVTFLKALSEGPLADNFTWRARFAADKSGFDQISGYFTDEELASLKRTLVAVTIEPKSL